MLKIISSTNCVHIVDNAYSDKLIGRVTLCNHVNYHKEHGEQFRHHWPLTTSSVTCKRCLVSLKKITDKLETKWTLKNANCHHRLPHPELGIVCTEPKRTNYCRLHRPKSFRKCLKRYCPISFHQHKPVKKHPLECESNPIMETIEYIIKELGETIVAADKRFKAHFAMMSERCLYRKPTKMMSKKVDTVYQCKNPKLKDPNFGWSCSMGNCPYMNRAMDWRANNIS